jgi:histidine triad (HIT) family protein
MMALVPRLAMAGRLPALSRRRLPRVTNTGAEGGQEVHHLHFHVIGGPRPWLKG